MNAAMPGRDAPTPGAGGRPVRGRGRHLVFAAITLVATLGLLEAATRRLVPEFWTVERLPEQDVFLAAHPTRGYAFRPSFTDHWRNEDFDIEVRLNERGLRDGPLAEIAEGDPRLLALGDSYTFGIGVRADERWPGQLEQRLATDLGATRRPQVLDAGIPGYSARQIRELAEELIPLIHPQVVVFGMYADSYWRVENPYRLFDQTLITTDRLDAMALGRDGELLITAFPPGGLRTLDLWFKQHFHLGAHLLALANGGRHWPERPPRAHSPEAIAHDYAPVLDEIGRMDRLARDAGARLVVLAINAQEADGSFTPEQALYNDVLRDDCAARQIPFVDPLPDLVAGAAGRRLYRFAHDTHWTVAAHAIAARRVEETILKEGLLSTRSAAVRPEPRPRAESRRAT